MRAIASTLALLLTLAATGPASAQEAAPVCPRDAEPVAAEWQAWGAPRSIVAATTTTGLLRAQVRVGQAYAVKLAPTAALKLRAVPERAPRADTGGGMVRLKLTAPGQVRIGLSQGAWIDVIGANGKAAVSTAHGHGPKCSGIRKIVDFDLGAGDWTIQLSGSPAKVVTLMVASPAPAEAVPAAAEKF